MSQGSQLDLYWVFTTEIQTHLNMSSGHGSLHTRCFSVGKQTTFWNEALEQS